MGEKDWHPADIVAALHKAGWSLRRLSRHHGYKTNALKSALQRPWPLAESLIAQTLGKAPREIWPSRYTADGLPNRRPGPKRRSLHEHKDKSTKFGGLD